MAKNTLPSENIQRCLLEIVEHFDREDRDVRERQIRKCKRLKLFWDNIFQAWYSEVAHDWRVWDRTATEDVSDQGYYDKPINIFRTYIDTIIAALSVTTPAAKCFPYDADNSLDVTTAKAGDKISRLINNHNAAPLLWLRALVTYYTEGTVFGYSYPRTDAKYGTYEKPKYEESQEVKRTNICPECGAEEPVEEGDPETQDEFMPEQQQDLCPSCGNQVMMQPGMKTFVVTKMVGKSSEPKTRVCLEVFGGLYVKIANYAKTACDTPYLIYSYETHFANAMEEYEHLLGNDKLLRGLKNQGTGPRDTYAQWGRMNTVYMGEYPNYVVTMRKAWLRPAAFNILGNKLDEIKELKKLYPRGVKVCLVNDEFGSAEEQLLDDYWSISVNPSEDYLVHDPAGIPLINPQDITNDIISLVLQTIEHGIGQTFADPGVLNFKAYRDTETLPGGVYEATPKSGKSVSDGFFQMKTATLSPEIMPFFETIQSMAQMVSGALPSLFGGQLEGSKTASEYSMSQAQARQRIQNIHKLFTHWWKEVQGKAIPIYINNMKEDENNVVELPDGSFINMFIRMSELSGRIGKIELEASESLPLTWTQVKDTVMKLIEVQNPMFMEILASPENIPIVKDAIGLSELYIPGEDDRQKQNDEIRQLLASEPIGDPMTGQFMPSVEIDPTFDKHPIQFEVVRQWATSEAGRLAKIENEAGYQNVLLHGQMHYFEMNKQMVLANTAGTGAGENNPEKPEGSQEVEGEGNVPTIQ
jgi:hypothetical protein